MLEGHLSSVWAVAISRDGKRALSGSWDKTVRVWDLEVDRLIAIFTCDAALTSCAWREDCIIVGDSGGQVHVFAWEE